jgi:arylsulfatase A-like enzyme
MIANGDTRLRARDTLLLAAVGALVAGAVHTTWFYIQSDILDRLVGASRELPWMSPLAYLAYYAPLALLLISLGKIFKVFARPMLQGAVIGAATALGLLFHITWLHPAALLVLGIGAGIQGGRVLARAPERGLRFTKRVGTVLAALTFVAGFPGAVIYRVQQRLQVASLSTAKPDSPNVILLILDTVRSANLGTYGYSRPTSPNMDRLGADGVVFETAIATAPWTGPSHASMLTGRYPFYTGIGYRARMTDSLPTVAEVLRENGYATAAFMGNANWAGRKTGFDRGFIRYDDYPLNRWQVLWSATFTQLDLISESIRVLRAGESWRIPKILRNAEFRRMGEHASERPTADYIAARFNDWVDGQQHRPFFVMMNLWDAHEPYRSPNPERFNKGLHEIDRYDASIAFADSLIGVMVGHLEARGELDRTVIIVTADHGQHFGEHKLRGHGNSLYFELIHVPLIVRAPRFAPAGQRVSPVVSLRDIPATVLDLAGIRDPRVPGTSLAGLWRDTTQVARSHVVSEVDHPDNRVERWPTSYGPMKSLVTDEYHYIRRGDGAERVFAWKGDTTGRGDLTTTELGIRAIAASRAVLEKELGPNWIQKGPTAVPNPR